jgi:hypothetical protein
MIVKMIVVRSNPQEIMRVSTEEQDKMEVDFAKKNKTLDMSDVDYRAYLLSA